MNKVLFKNTEIPEILIDEFNTLTDDQRNLIKSSMKQSLEAINKGDFKIFLNLN